MPYGRNDAMTTLTRIDHKARPFSPGPLAEGEAAALFRAALNLFRLWEVNDDQASICLVRPRRSYPRWKAGGLGRVSRDGEARLSNLMGIHRPLRTIFREPARGY